MQTARNDVFSNESDLEFIHIGSSSKDILPFETPMEDSRMVSTVMTTIIENYSTVRVYKTPISIRSLFLSLLLFGNDHHQENILLQPTALVEPNAPVKIFKQEDKYSSSQGYSQTGFQNR